MPHTVPFRFRRHSEVRTTVRRTSLGVLAFRERLSRINELGVLLAAAAIAVLTLG
jgi:hypothetical protein